MYIAQELRKKSIAEYLLYMWQVEDIIRAYGCSLARIEQEYISRFDLDAAQREEELDWYGDLVRMMRQEGCMQQGHLQINKVLLQDVAELHARLLQSPKFPFYSAEYYRILPFIVELRAKSKDKTQNEIETCLNALYGVVLLRLQQKEITTETSHAIKEITTFVGMLSDYYIKDRTEGLKFEDD